VLSEGKEEDLLTLMNHQPMILRHSLINARLAVKNSTCDVILLAFPFTRCAFS
jgi:hypothetical protein